MNKKLLATVGGLSLLGGALLLTGTDPTPQTVYQKDAPQQQTAPIDDACKSVHVGLKRNSWPDLKESLVVEVRVEAFDGKEWQGIGGFGSTGAEWWNQEKHATSTEDSFEGNLPDGTGRQIRATVDAKTAVISSLNITCSYFDINGNLITL